jgi:hypothetical protein
MLQENNHEYQQKIKTSSPPATPDRPQQGSEVKSLPNHTQGYQLNGHLAQLNLTRSHLDLYASLLGLYPSPTIQKGQRGRMANRCPSRFGYIKVYNQRWISVEPHWKLSDSNLAQHLTNNNTFGIKGHPGGTRWLDIDIDHAEHNADDPRLRKITEFLYENLVSYDGRPRYLVQYRQTSGNFSILLRADGHRADTHQQQLTELCHYLGLEVGPGKIEFFPDPQRGRRLPFGDQLVFEEGSFNELIPVALKKDQIEKFANLEPIRAGQLKKLIPLSIVKPTDNNYQSHKPAVSQKSLAAYPLSSWPQLQQPGTRWEMEKRIGVQCYKRGLNVEQCQSSLQTWFENGGTADHSKEYKADPSATVERARSHMVSLYKWCRAKGISSQPILKPDFRLRVRDFEKINSLNMSLKGQEFLYDLLLWAGQRQGAMQHLYLSAGIMAKFRNGSRPGPYLAQLDQRGILKCTNRNYAKGQQSRTYQLNWSYASSHTKEVDPYKSYRALLRQHLKKSQIEQLRRRDGETEISRRDVGRIWNGEHIQQHGRKRKLKADKAWLMKKYTKGKFVSPPLKADAERGTQSKNKKEESIKGGKVPNISTREQIRQSLGPRDPEREAARAEFERRRQELSSGRAPGRD